MKKIGYILLSLLGLIVCSCSDDVQADSLLPGLWQQEQVFVDGVACDLSEGEAATTVFIESNGVYRLFDGTTSTVHPGTWLVSDDNWLNMSMDKIQGKNNDGTYRFGQYLVRFTIEKVTATELELRIRTYLRERKLTVMFNLIGSDNTDGMTGEELLELDTLNKQLHTYRYVFKKVND